VPTLKSIVYSPDDGTPDPADHYFRVPLAQAALTVEGGIHGDRKGRHPDRQLNVMGTPALAELAALLAGDLAASSEIAHLTGTYQRHQLILREGETLNSFISEAGNDLVLFVHTTAEVPLGWARLLLQEAAHRIAELKLDMAEPIHSAEVPGDEDGFEKRVKESIDGLWDQGKSS